MSVIHIEGLSKSFGSNLVFRDIHVDIEKGDCVSVIGPSGCGKSTFLRCINLLEQPTAGKVYIDGSSDPLDEPYIMEPMAAAPDAVYVVPEDCYFVLGDNRNHSNDSRFWENTYVRSDQIIAKALFRYFPRIGRLET